MRARERGATLTIILVVLALTMVAFLAIYALSRFGTSSDDRGKTKANLESAAAALENFAATAERLPCPANPALSSALETGLEVRNGAKACTYPEGVVPWGTIGLRRDDAYDAWGRRLSYRVYTGSGGGNSGSLVQAYGVSMVHCDTWELTGGATDADGLCVRSATPTSRSTSEAAFLAGKGLRVADMGATRTDVAYLVISHGSTGLGAYTGSGTQTEMPKGAERENMRETGASGASGGFTISAFSGAETKANANDHFDDVIVYRGLSELVKRINLVARDWPDLPPAGATRFDLATVSARPGVTVSETDTATGQVIIDFGPVAVVGVAGGSIAEISFSTAGAGGLGVTFGANPKMTWGEGEWLIFLFDDTGTRFGVTLSDFGTFSQSGTTMSEKVALYFYRNGSPVATVVKSACRADGQLASLDVDPGTSYDAVIVAPIASTGTSAGAPVSGDTGFLVSEVRTCPTGSTNCRTFLSSAENTCS